VSRRRESEKKTKKGVIF